MMGRKSTTPETGLSDGIVAGQAVEELEEHSVEELEEH